MSGVAVFGSVRWALFDTGTAKTFAEDCCALAGGLARAKQMEFGFHYAHAASAIPDAVVACRPAPGVRLDDLPRPVPSAEARWQYRIAHDDECEFDPEDDR